MCDSEAAFEEDDSGATAVEGVGTSTEEGATGENGEDESGEAVGGAVGVTAGVSEFGGAGFSLACDRWAAPSSSR